LQDVLEGIGSKADASLPLVFTLVLMSVSLPNPASLPERKQVESSRKVSCRPKPLFILRSMEEKYVAAMKKLQFGEFACCLWCARDVCVHIYCRSGFFHLISHWCS